MLFKFLLGIASYLLPLLLFVVAGVAAIPAYYFIAMLAEYGTLLAVMGLPFAYLIWGFSLCAVAVSYKHITFYHTTEGSFSYASWQVAQWGIMTRLVEFCNTVLMIHLRSTPFINIWFRLLGAKIGKDVFINTIELTDWDLLTIGDNTMLGAGVVMQAHAAEDGRLHFRPVSIGQNCSIGRSAVILPGVEIGDRSTLGAMSVAVKNKKIPNRSIWGGVPAQHIKFKAESKKDREDRTPADSSDETPADSSDETSAEPTEQSKTSTGLGAKRKLDER